MSIFNFWKNKEFEEDLSKWKFPNDSTVWVFHSNGANVVLKKGKVLSCDVEKGILSIVYSDGGKVTFNDLRRDAYYDYCADYFYINELYDNSKIFTIIMQSESSIKKYISKKYIINNCWRENNKRIKESSGYKKLLELEENPTLENLIKYIVNKEKSNFIGEFVPDSEEKFYNSVKNLIGE